MGASASNFNHLQMSHHHNPDRYHYKHCWIEIFLDFDEAERSVLYFASIELPDQGGVIDTETYPTRVEAELAAAQLIDAGESELQPR